MENKDITKSIIDKFNEQVNADKKKIESANKANEDEVKPEDKTEAKDAETKETNEVDKADKETKSEPEAEKQADKKTDSKEPEKPVSKEETEKPKAEDTKEPTKDVEKKSKDVAPKDTEKAPEVTKKSEIKATENVEKSEKDTKVTKESAKPEKTTKSVDSAESVSLKKSAAKSASGVVSLPTEQFKELAKSITGSYEVINQRQDAANKDIKSVMEVVKSIKEELLPTIAKATKLLAKNDLATEDTNVDPDPEQVALKSAQLEEKQHAESVSKSASDKQDDTFAKDENSSLVDDVIDKSEDSSVVKTQTEKVTKSTELTGGELSAAARFNVHAFLNRMTEDVHKGAISESDISKYTRLVNDVQTGQATETQERELLNYARGK